MNFSQTYFHKELDQLSCDDLIEFFKHPQKESQYLEFKSSRESNVDLVFNRTLKPAICSFLNSEGGILIFGAPSENKSLRDNPYGGDFSFYKRGFLGDHDTIIRKISDGITPMSIGIRLKEIEFPEGNVAVFEIQESLTKPHQTDNLYQIRIDGQKKIAPHYLIEAMMKKVTFPDIRAYIRVMDNSWLDYASDILCVKFELFLINFSEFQNEKNIRYRFKIDGPMAFDQHGHIQETDYKKLEVLSFGEPASSKIEIFGNFGMLREERNVNLNIVFHGESSPSKITTYKFNIVPYNFRGVLSEGKAFLEIDNSLLSEHQKNLGISHKESLKKNLGLEF